MLLTFRTTTTCARPPTATALRPETMGYSQEPKVFRFSVKKVIYFDFVSCVCCNTNTSLREGVATVQPPKCLTSHGTRRVIIRSESAAIPPSTARLQKIFVPGHFTVHHDRGCVEWLTKTCSSPMCESVGITAETIQFAKF
jgi:hypothetical protein